MKTEKNKCKVCGYLLDYNPWGEDGKTPDYSYCPSCGVEFGNQDYKLESIKKFRENWFQEGMPWSGGENQSQPQAWDPKEQIKNIPEDFL